MISIGYKISKTKKAAKKKNVIDKSKKKKSVRLQKKRKQLETEMFSAFNL